MIGILPKLTKPYILSRLSQVEIFAKYLQISEFEIYNCLNNKQIICSPLRLDNHPTCGFYLGGNNVIRFRDFAGYFHGDCFDLVAYRLIKDTSIPQHFNEVLEDIAREFKIHKYSTSTNNTTSVYDFLEVHKYKKPTVIDAQITGWSSVHTNYYKRFLIDKRKCEEFLCYPISKAWVNKQLVYNFSLEDICFGFYHGKDEEGRDLWKLYFPFRKDYRFITNTKRLQGLNKLREAKIGLITKALKDVMSIDNFGVNSVGVAGETIFPSSVEIELLQSYWEVIYSLMDFDRTGILMAQYLKKNYGIKPLFFTNGKFNTIDFGAKDHSDFVKEWGWYTTEQLMRYLLTNGVEQDNEYFEFLEILLDL
jgi:hypothetical protein